MKYEISEYLLNHRDGIKETLAKLATQAKDNPILLSHFHEAVVKEVIMMLTDALNLNYEEVAEVVEYDFLVELLGKEFFSL